MLPVDPIYTLIIVPAMVVWIAQAMVVRSFRRYSTVPVNLEWSGQDLARQLLDRQGLCEVGVEVMPGRLTDHYDPLAKKLRVSQLTAQSRSVAALGVVAHEVGHAMQDAEGYGPLRLRTDLALRASQAGMWSPIVFTGGLLLGIPVLMALGIAMLVSQAFVALLALPVERDASARALSLLDKLELATAEEREGVRKVLQAAAFTYLADVGRRLSTLLIFVVLVLVARGLLTV